jgi:predicted transcriptional regulator
MVKLLLPQEVETFYIIPALRKHIAIALKKSGMKQKDVADILQVNSAAISQYSSSKS